MYGCRDILFPYWHELILIKFRVYTIRAISISNDFMFTSFTQSFDHSYFGRQFSYLGFYMLHGYLTIRYVGSVI